jgi:hypothetical protein
VTFSRGLQAALIVGAVVILALALGAMAWARRPRP